MNFQGKYYPWLSTALFGALILAIAYYIGTRTGKAKKEGEEENALKKEIQKDELTFEQTQYVSMADKLEVAMFGFGDDEDSIYSVFSKLRSKSDLLQLIKTFGTRRIHLTIGNTNLNYWLNNRLNNAEIAHVNDILSRNGIDYQF